MKARCTACNRAVEFNHSKGSKLSQMQCKCGAASFVLMRQREVEGEAPLDGFTHRMFGKVYHKIYTGGGGEWLWHRNEGKFVSI